jgi:lysozyme
MSRFDTGLLERALQTVGKPAAPAPVASFSELATFVAVDLARRFEGCRLRPYLCPAGVPTIGYGATRYADGRPVQLTDPPMTQAGAEAMLLASVRGTYLPAVLVLCPGVTDPRRLAALIDFTFNLGAGSLRSSTLRKRVNANRWGDVPTELARWVRAGGRVLPGLVLRRQAEADLI